MFSGHIVMLRTLGSSGGIRIQDNETTYVLLSDNGF
jgi:hypothetical protein